MNTACVNSHSAGGAGAWGVSRIADGAGCDKLRADRGNGGRPVVVADGWGACKRFVEDILLRCGGSEKRDVAAITLSKASSS